ncbi:glucose-6-phosphate 1-epimerase [Granulicella rosea]|uniref:Putative glucose-6-phosphate 1-epimerase n=1 Tax=Granulicella rosea TaxID=474952 RepID=A0A239DCP7_9BACT|nr:D-hexose-6-phosphate mutarotase [Granulicella rosea]SNS30099.1 glucose-6-phosphate 1-epimerase [Granulicella rosea]
MDIATLNDHFGLPGVLAFEDHAGLTRARITTPACTATVYLHGAHLTHWQPTGQKPVLFLSDKSEFAANKAIRGGVPICFPWFGARTGVHKVTLTGDRADGPMHGFARLQSWTVAFAALSPADGSLRLVLTLDPSPESQALGFDHFRAVYELSLGATLTMKLTVANGGTEPLVFEEALHTYFAVGDAGKTLVHGLEGATYYDKTDGMATKHMPAEPFLFTQETDRALPSTTANVVIEDTVNARRIHVDKSGSNTSVVWNPWKGMADLDASQSHQFVCVETVNGFENAITLTPGESHSMTAHIGIESV